MGSSHGSTAKEPEAGDRVEVISGYYAPNGKRLYGYIERSVGSIPLYVVYLNGVSGAYGFDGNMITNKDAFVALDKIQFIVVAHRRLKEAHVLAPLDHL